MCLCALIFVCFWQHVLGAHGALTASTHVTVTMELSAALQMESVSAALDGQDSTALSVCFCLSHTQFAVHIHIQTKQNTLAAVRAHH